MMKNLHLRRMVATAVFLAISLVLRVTVSGYIPLFGANGVRVGIHGVFTIMPAILFGPWYGAVASGLGDLLGHFMRPSGAWIWQITAIMFFGGFVRGWMWRLLRGRSPVATRSAVIAITIAFLGFGSFSFIQLRQDGITRDFYDNIAAPSAVATYDMTHMGRLVISRTQNTGNPTNNLSDRIAEVMYAPLGAGVFGIVLLGVDMLLTKYLRKEGHGQAVVAGNNSFTSTWREDNKQDNDSIFSKLTAPWNGSIMPLALTIIIVSLMMNTANSIVLWAVSVPAWSVFPFMYIWLPRAIVSLLTSIVNVFIAVLLMGVCKRQPHLKALVE